MTGDQATAGTGAADAAGRVRTSYIASRYAALTPAKAMLLCLTVGAVVRIAHLLVFDPGQPIVMGGLFLQFADGIAANGFLPPERIPFYSEGGVPFLYPPLAFYLLALLTHGLGVPDFLAINLLAPALAVVSIPLFYRLARRLTPDWRQAALATFLFALLPNAVAEQVEAAGLAEALGTVMLLLFLTTLADLARRPGWRAALVSGAVLGICVWSSPGSAMGGALSAVLFTFWFMTRHAAPRAMKFRLILTVAVLSVAVAAPYFIHVMSAAPPQTFFSALMHEMKGDTIAHDSLGLRVWSLFSRFALVEPPVFLWQALALCGLVLALTHRTMRGVALWTLITFLLVPREGRWVVAPGVALLCAHGFAAIFAWARARAPRPSTPWAVAAGSLILLVALFPHVTPLRAIYGTYPVFAASVAWARDTPEVFAWARRETPAEARFIVIADDYTLELAPRLMQRTVLNVPWGTEFEVAKWEAILQANAKLRDCTQFTDCLPALVAVLPPGLPVNVTVGAKSLDCSELTDCLAELEALLPPEAPVYLLATSAWFNTLRPLPEGWRTVFEHGRARVVRLQTN